MTQIDEIKKYIRSGKENIFSKLVKDKKYTQVLGFFDDEIISLISQNIPLKMQINLINDAIQKAGFEDFKIEYKTYQKYCSRNNFTTQQNKKTISPPASHTKQNETKTTRSKVDEMKEALGDLLKS